MTKTKLTTEEQEAYRKEQQTKIANQQAQIAEILATNQEIEQIQQALSKHKFRPEAYAAIPKQSEEYQTILDQERINARIKPIKTGELTQIGDKPSGQSESVLVAKSPKSPDSKAAKHYNTWIKKTGDTFTPIPNENEEIVMVKDPGSEGHGEQFCEYIGTNLFNEIMEENSPKIRIHKAGDGQITILSKFINDAKGDEFQTIQDINTKNPKKSIAAALGIDNLREVQGFAKLFVATSLFGDNDGHEGNVGIRKRGNNYYWVRIDNGKSLSYNVRKRFGLYTKISYQQASQTATDFKENMLSTEIYPEEFFRGLDFAHDLAQEVAQINNKNLSHIIKKSMLYKFITYETDQAARIWLVYSIGVSPFKLKCGR